MSRAGAPRHFTLRTVPAPREGACTVAVPAPSAGTVIRRGDETDLCFDCGGCGAALLVGVGEGCYPNQLLQCGACGAFNESSKYTAAESVASGGLR